MWFQPPWHIKDHKFRHRVCCWIEECHPGLVLCLLDSRSDRGGVPMGRRRNVLTLWILASLLGMVSVLTGQVQNGQFTGIVTDPSGAAIANATVTATNQGTGLSVSATSNQGGAYTAKELPVGTYKLSAEAPGFKTV